MDNFIRLSVCFLSPVISFTLISVLEQVKGVKWTSVIKQYVNK